MEKYTKVKQLGKGSFGAAILVKRIKDSAYFVAKEVSLAKMSPKEREEARHEVKILSQLNHPNITRYVEHSEKGGVLYIIMEYADGGDLHQLIKKNASSLASGGGYKYGRNPRGGVQQRKGPGGSNMTEASCLHYFSQLCLAIDYLHGRHILHRDIKSMNVFLTSNGTVKLGDFGISTILRNTIGMAKTVCGTPYYFSPELCRSKPYNNKSDVWALGVVLYELAMQKHPFDGSSMASLMQRICRGQYTPLPMDNTPQAQESLESTTGFTPAFRSLIANCMEIDVKRRYNIKQVLASRNVAISLQKLEKNLMLATLCKVRLQTIFDNFEDNKPGQQGAAKAIAPPPPQQQQQQARVVAIPADPYRAMPLNKLAAKPVAPTPAPPPPVSKPSAAIPAPNPGKEAYAGAAHGIVRNAQQVRANKEIAQVDYLLNHLQRKENDAFSKDRVEEILRKKKLKEEQDAEEKKRKEVLALQAYEERHKQLQRMMADHKKRIDDNARLKKEKEQKLAAEIKRRVKPALPKQKVPAAKPTPAVKPTPLVVPPSNPSPTAPTPSPPVSKPVEPLDAARQHGGNHARFRRGVAANCCTPIKKSKPASDWGDAPPTKSEVVGMGEYFERRRNQQDAPIGVPTAREEMPAGVAARRGLMGAEDPTILAEKSAEEEERLKGIAAERLKAQEAREAQERARLQVLEQQRAARAAKEEAVAKKRAEEDKRRAEEEKKRAEEERKRKVEAEVAVLSSGIDAIEEEVSFVDVRRRSEPRDAAYHEQVEREVENINLQLANLRPLRRDLLQQAEDDVMSEESVEELLARPTNEVEEDHVDNHTDLAGATLTELVGTVRRRHKDGSDEDETGTPDESGQDDTGATERADDYNTMMLHIQTLISNTKAGHHHQRPNEGGNRIHHQPLDEDVHDVPLTPARVPARLPLPTQQSDDESEYILDNEEELQPCSDDSDSYDGFSSSDNDEDTGSSGGSDFGDIVPLTPQKKKAPTGSGGGRGSRMLSEEDDASLHFFPLSHMCGPHFTGAFPVDHGGEELHSPELSVLSSSDPPTPQVSLGQLEACLLSRLTGLMGDKGAASTLLKQVDALLVAIKGTDEDRDVSALDQAKERLAKAGGHEPLDEDEVTSLLALCAQKVFFAEQVRDNTS